ncbi:VOC family protein [Streptomyces sp. AC495_CC817]|uniref:VOC family protein n=1 Tax=Streptomyces sp. AC495_CC817 TaxID=2823900 RepID=UPI001C271AC5|nr:VOC family protein [Streptomyces sp. AC495_CC817]
MGASLRIELFPADLDRALGFYTRGLGFELVQDDRALPKPYAAVRRDAVRIGFLSAPGAVGQRVPPLGAEIVIEVDDITAERDRVVANGAVLLDDLQTRAWGLTDFRLLDPDGHFLRFTNRTDES